MAVQSLRMPVRLFHFTSQLAAKAIVARGFDGPTCWLSPDPETICGEDGRAALIEVMLDVDEAELQPFAQEVEEEVWDEAAGQFIPDPAPRSYTWYEVPTAVVAERGRTRLIGSAERGAWMTGLDPFKD